MQGANGWRLPPFVSCRLHFLFYFKDPSPHYSQELVRFETGASDQGPVHAMPAEECRGVIRHHATAILNGEPMRLRLAIDLAELTSQEGVGILRLLWGRMVVRIADRPDRFVCNAQMGQGFRRDSCKSKFELPIEQSFRLVGLSLFHCLANTKDDLQTAVQGTAHLLIDECV